VDPAKQLEWLANRHARLKAEVAELGARAYLTPAEEVTLRNLKKEKLRTKDSLEAMRRDSRGVDLT
jgi:hypothetical protein